MQYLNTVVRRLSGGGFKACIWGQTDSHVMDRRGCNYRLLTIPGQPRQGFSAQEEAVAFLRSKFGHEAEAKQWAWSQGDGSFMSDDHADSIVVLNAWVEAAS